MKHEVNLFKLIWINLFRNRKLAIINVLFFLINFFVFLNPYSNNSGDFFTTSNLLILFGWLFTFCWTICLTTMLDSQLNINLLSEKISSSEKMNITSTAALLIYFSSLHLLLLAIFNLYYFFLFGYSWTMSFHISMLYINYFFASFLISFFLGLIVARSMKKVPFITGSVIFLVLLIGIAFVINFDLSLKGFNQVFLTDKDYYHPFTGIENFTLAFYLKLIIIAYLLSGLSFQLLTINKKVKALSLFFALLFTLSSTFFIFNNNYEASKSEFYTDSYVNEYEKNSGNQNKVALATPNYSIASYQIQLLNETQPLFIVDMDLEKLKVLDLTFYLHDSFKVSEVLINNENVSYQQQGNRIDTHLTSTDNQTITFKYSGEGTALNPIQKNYLFLPYFFNWLPQERDTKDYFVRDNTTVEFNPHNKECNGIKNISSDIPGLLIHQSDDTKCLSVMKGDYSQKTQENISIHYPKVWSGNTGEQKTYSDLSERVREEFNATFKEDMDLAYNSLFIVPKFEVFAQPGLNDMWVKEGIQIILVDPFININSESLFKEISKNAPFSLSYMLLREKNNGENEEEIELLSVLFAIYFIEKNSIPVEDSYLDYYQATYNSKEIKGFFNLDLNQKKNRLIEIFESL